MAAWNYSIVFLCLAADQSDSDAISELLGYGPRTFSLPAGPEGATEPTHYFNHSFAAQEFVDMVEALGQGTPPEGMPENLLPALSRMAISVREGGDPVGHVNDVLAEQGLSRLTQTE